MEHRDSNLYRTTTTTKFYSGFSYKETVQTYDGQFERSEFYFNATYFKLEDDVLDFIDSLIDKGQ